MSFVYLEFLFISHVGFKSVIWLLIAPVPVHCFSITFVIYYLSSEQERSVPLLYSYAKSGFYDNESQLFFLGQEIKFNYYLSFIIGRHLQPFSKTFFP